MILPRMALAFSPATSGLKFTKGVGVLENGVKAVLNSCWEPELRAVLLIYKSQGKWEISPECISVLPQVCKRMVDKTMNPRLRYWAKFPFNGRTELDLNNYASMQTTNGELIHQVHARTHKTNQND